MKYEIINHPNDLFTACVQYTMYKQSNAESFNYITCLVLPTFLFTVTFNSLYRYIGGDEIKLLIFSNLMAFCYQQF